MWSRARPVDPLLGGPEGDRAVSCEQRVRLTVLGMLVALAAAMFGCGSASLSTEEARGAIEDLPYRVSVHELDGESGLLIGAAHGEGNAVVHFAMVTDIENDAVPPHLRTAAGGNITGGGGWFVFRDHELPGGGQRSAEDREQVEISVAIDEALSRSHGGSLPSLTREQRCDGRGTRAQGNTSIHSRGGQRPGQPYSELFQETWRWALVPA
jgi:hypothetical protein